MRKPQQQTNKPGVTSPTSTAAHTNNSNNAQQQQHQLGGNFASSAIAAGKRRQQEQQQRGGGVMGAGNHHHNHSLPSGSDSMMMMGESMSHHPSGAFGNSNNNRNHQIKYTGDPGETFDVLEIDLSLFASSAATSSLSHFGNQSITRERRIEILPNVVLLRTLNRKIPGSSNNNNTELGIVGDDLSAGGESAAAKRDKEMSSGPVVSAVSSSQEPRIILYLDSGWFHFLDKSGNESSMLILPRKRDVKQFANLIEKHLLHRPANSNNNNSSNKSLHQYRSSMMDSGGGGDVSSLLGAHSNHRISFSPRMSTEIQMPLGVSYPMHPVFVGEDGEIKDQHRLLLGSGHPFGAVNNNNNHKSKDGNNNNKDDGDDDAHQKEADSILDSVLKRSESKMLAKHKNSANNSSIMNKTDLSMIRDLELRKLLEVTDAEASDVDTFLNFGVTPLSPAIVETAQALLIACQASNPISSTVIKLAETVSSSLKTHEISGRMHLATPVCKAAVISFHALLQLANNSPAGCAQDGAGDAIVIAIERCVSCLLVGGYESCIGLPDDEDVEKQKRQQQQQQQGMMNGSSSRRFSDGTNNNNSDQSNNNLSTPAQLPPSQLCRELTQHLATALVLIENYHALLNDRMSVTKMWGKNNNDANFSFDDILNRYQEMDEDYAFSSRRNGSSSSNTNHHSSHRQQLLLMWVSATAPIIHRGFLLISSLVTSLPQLPNQILHQDLANMFPSNLTLATHSTSSTYLNSSSSASKTKNVDAFVSLHCCLALSKVATRILISWSNKVLDYQHTMSSSNSNSNNSNNYYSSSSSLATTTLSGQVVLRSCSVALTLCTNLLENSLSERAMAAITSRSIVNQQNAAASAAHLLVSKAWENDSKEAMFRIFHLHTRLSEISTYLSTNHHHILLNPKIDEDLLLPSSSNNNRKSSSFSGAGGGEQNATSSSFMCWDQVTVALSTPLRRSAAWFGSLFPPQRKRSSSSSKSGFDDDENNFDDNDDDGIGEDSYFNAGGKDGNNSSSNQNSDDRNNNNNGRNSQSSSSLQQNVRRLMARAACRYLAARSSIEAMSSSSVLNNTISAEINNVLYNFSRKIAQANQSNKAAANYYNYNNLYSPSRSNNHGSAGDSNSNLYHVQHVILPTVDFQPGAIWLVRCAVLCGASLLRQEMIGTSAVLLRLQMLAVERCGRAVTPKNIFGPLLNRVKRQFDSNSSSSYHPLHSSSSSSADISFLSSSLAQVNLSSISHLSRVERVWTRWCSQLSAVVGACPQPSTAHSVWSTASLIVHRFAQSAVVILQKSSGVSTRSSVNTSSSSSSAFHPDSMSDEQMSNSSPAFFFGGGKSNSNNNNSNNNNPPLLCATMILSVPSTETLRVFSSPDTAASFIDEDEISGSCGYQQNNASSSNLENDDEEDNILFFGSFSSAASKNTGNNNNNASSSKFMMRTNNNNNKPPDALTYLAADSWDGLAEFENDRPATTSNNDDDGNDNYENDNNDTSTNNNKENYFLSTRYDHRNGNQDNRQQQHQRKRLPRGGNHQTSSSSWASSLSLTPNVQDEAFWYIDKSCEDRQENLRLMTASRRRLQAVQDAREAAAAPPSRCAIFAARAIRDFARAFFRTSQDVFDDDFSMSASQSNNNNSGASLMNPASSSSAIIQKFLAAAKRYSVTAGDEKSTNNNAAVHTISLICQELSNLFFHGSGSLQHACLASLPIVACIRQTGDIEESANQGSSGSNNPNASSLSFDEGIISSKTNSNNNNTGNLFASLEPSSSSNSNRQQQQQPQKTNQKLPLKKESILLSTLRSQRMLNQA